VIIQVRVCIEMILSCIELDIFGVIERILSFS
jgi:hypothetical protein